MLIEENKKVLFVVGMDQKLDYEYIERKYHLLPQEIIVIESDEVGRIQPFGDLMRDILKLVYVKRIEEILIVENKVERKFDLLEAIEKNLNINKKMATLDYLFDHCKTEFPNKSLKEWLLGDEEIREDKQDLAEILRSHPLMPNSINVKQGDETFLLL